MQITDYHAKYYAYELTKSGVNGIERLSRSLFDAVVDLNPHQIEAALFALRSPLTKGVILADEVGLGKTIEAGIVICQYWAELKRKLLIICPASLRKQWSLELLEKFNLPSTILDAKSYREEKNSGKELPFDSKNIVITSMHYASRNAEEIKSIKWDLVVIDEAHKLRNAYRPSNKIGQRISWAISDNRKLLLTATPLQNSLLELYGLSSIIDDRIFADLPSFRTQYVNTGGDLDSLRTRLNAFCKRTLRHQVTEFIPYTERKLITRPFEPTDQEQRLYNAVSAFLQRPDTYAMPYRQKHLTALIVRKLLASSPAALAGTLETMKNRLLAMKENLAEQPHFLENLIEEEEIEEELIDEIIDDPEALAEFESEQEGEKKSENKIDIEKLNAEIEELAKYISWASNIGIDTKAKTLLTALETGFDKMKAMGAAEKAVIFTESRRTQEYLRAHLEANGYKGKIVTFNGTNTDPESAAIYAQWLKNNEGSGRVTNSKQIDIRAALIEQFRDNGKLFIATEAAAEGINLQFCSLVINFDLPWNPQRIEQRIGRCHRYGQKNDVVVINFLNQKNEADRRVYELLEHKFNLFEGVFGASDEVLGAIESGIDFEKKILEIYQECRTPEAIKVAFDKLQKEFEESIKSRLESTKKILLEHFDEDVHERLRANLIDTKTQLDKFSRMFWGLTTNVLSENAKFNNTEMTFDLHTPPSGFKKGVYHLISKDKGTINSDYLYRLSHPLGEHSISEAKKTSTPTAEILFNVTDHPTKISMVESLKGKGGWLILERLIIESFEREEYLLFSGFTDAFETLTPEQIEKLFMCGGMVSGSIDIATNVKNRLDSEKQQHIKGTVARSLERNSAHFNEARDHLDKWADDMVVAAEKELKDTKEQLKGLNREARKAITLEEQEGIQKQIQELEKKKRKQRQEIFNIEDNIQLKRDNLITDLEKRMAQRISNETIFTIRWKVI